MVATACSNCAGETAPRSTASFSFSSLCSFTRSRLLRQWQIAYCSSERLCVSGMWRMAGTKSPSESMPTSRCSGRVLSSTTAASSAGPSSGSGIGKRSLHDDSTISRVMAKPAASPMKPSVRASASMVIAAISRSRERFLRMSSPRSRTSTQTLRAAAQPPSEESPSSARRSIRRASSRRSRRADRAALPSSES